MNTDNLIPMNKRTKKEQREIAKKGGIASGKIRRKKRDRRKELEELLSQNYEDDNKNTVKISELLNTTLIKIATDPKNRLAIIAQKYIDEIINKDSEPLEEELKKLNLELKRKEIELLQIKIDNNTWE